MFVDFYRFCQIIYFSVITLAPLSVEIRQPEKLFDQYYDVLVFIRWGLVVVCKLFESSVIGPTTSHTPNLWSPKSLAYL